MKTFWHAIRTKTDGRTRIPFKLNHLMKDIWLVTTNGQAPRCINQRMCSGISKWAPRGVCVMLHPNVG